MFLLKESRSFFRQGWTIAVLLIALLVSLPILSVASSLLTNSSQVWQHLIQIILLFILNSRLTLLYLEFRLGYYFQSFITMNNALSLPQSRQYWSDLEKLKT